MACPLSAILNTVDGSAQSNQLPAIRDENDDATISETSIESLDGGLPGEKMLEEEKLRSNPLTKRRRGPLEIKPGTVKSASRGIIPPAILAPKKDCTPLAQA